MTTMITKRILIPERARQVPSSFSWIDHRLLRHGYLQDLSPAQMLLYFFLVLVGDCHGVSYYSLRSISKILKLSNEQLAEARDTLCKSSLIAYQPPFYQVLSLPVPNTVVHSSKHTCSKNGAVSIGEILKKLWKEENHGH